MRPNIVALGGGHGLAVALGAIREYAGEITAVVSVADDGGSSGRLRRDLDVPAPGDLRRCLVALASDTGPWPAAFEHRFRSGELADHALGNLVLVGLAETLGDLVAALDEAGRLLGTVGRVLPATLGPVSMTARVGGERVTGQVAIAVAGERGRIRDVRLMPENPPGCPDALEAIARADQIVLAPGSLYTSIVAVLCVPEIRAAIGRAPGRVVQIANLETENETAGHDGTDHLAAVRDQGGRVDQFLYDPDNGLAVDSEAVSALGVEPVAVSIAGAAGSGHDPQQLAKALAALL
ncbi:MAG TPA: gluconeogenesis factor YvcK family protein [Acidimicrobiia bacterium]